MSDFSDQGVLAVDDLGDAATSSPGDELDGGLEQPGMAMPDNLANDITGSVVVYPGDTWAALSRFYKSDIDTLKQLNPDVADNDGVIAGIVSEFRVPFKRYG